jgi:hypothetical protein
MYFLANAEKKVYAEMSPNGRLMFDKFDLFDDPVKVAIFPNEHEAVNCANFLNREYKGMVTVSVHPLSELESFLKGV